MSGHLARMGEVRSAKFLSEYLKWGCRCIWDDNSRMVRK